MDPEDKWEAVIQLSQECDHKKSFFYMQQVILKHGAHRRAIYIMPRADGFDFYFSSQEDGEEMVAFLKTDLPCMGFMIDWEVLSHDKCTNRTKYRCTYTLFMAPVCKDYLLCFSEKVAQELKVPQLCLVTSITNKIHLIDACTLQCADSKVEGYNYAEEYNLAQASPKQLVEYIVMDVEPMSEPGRPSGPGVSTKYGLADVYVARVSDLGVNDQQFHCRTHLAYLLKTGDAVLGYDFTNDDLKLKFLEKMKQEDKIPDVVLVRKTYDRSERLKRRNWKLQKFDGPGLWTNDPESVLRDYEDFLDDLEEDEAMRAKVNIFRDQTKPATTEEADDAETPHIRLADMLEEVHISDEVTLTGEGALN